MHNPTYLATRSNQQIIMLSGGAWDLAFQTVSVPKKLCQSNNHTIFARASLAKKNCSLVYAVLCGDENSLN